MSKIETTRQLVKQTAEHKKNLTEETRRFRQHVASEVEAIRNGIDTTHSNQKK